MAIKYIFDTKTIMTDAWARARRMAKQANNSRGYPVNTPRKARDYIVFALLSEWKFAREALAKAIEMEKEYSPKKSGNKATRYLALLSVAQRDGLSHGKAWYCGEREIETMGMNPCHEGELVCYVYA